MNASGLHHLLVTPFTTVNSILCMALTKKWHNETRNLHLSVGEKTITLDDESCLLHIPIHES